MRRGGAGENEISPVTIVVWRDTRPIFALNHSLQTVRKDYSQTGRNMQRDSLGWQQ